MYFCWTRKVSNISAIHCLNAKFRTQEVCSLSSRKQNLTQSALMLCCVLRQLFPTFLANDPLKRSLLVSPCCGQLLSSGCSVQQKNDFLRPGEEQFIVQYSQEKKAKIRRKSKIIDNLCSHNVFFLLSYPSDHLQTLWCGLWSWPPGWEALFRGMKPTLLV